mmetsp:Transcript_12979/g.32838  ORF Transcript_12979/g.32838 Transcript_12979/m.32838 type:complete len:885 (+) Transcript_12979:456-3110(+)
MSPSGAMTSSAARSFAKGAPPRETLPPHLCGSDHRTRVLIDQLMEDAQCGLVVVDALEADNPIIYADNEFQRQSGYHVTEIMGRNCRFLQYRGPYATERHPEIDGTSLAKIRIAIRQGTECKVQLLNFAKDGRPLWNNLHLLPIFGDQRSPSLVTHYAGLVHFAPFDRAPGLAPMQLQQRLWSANDSGMPESKVYFPVAEIGSHGPTVFMLGSELLLKLMSLLDPWSLAKLSLVDCRFHELCRSNSVWRNATANQWGQHATEVLDTAGWRLGWANIAKEIVTFEALHWRRFKVGGTVNPRSNFSACAVGNQFVIFGGEGLSGQPLNDTYILDLSCSQPAWQVLDVKYKPQGRWGHTLRWLRDSWVVLFGGCGAQGSLNDLYLLDISAEVKMWHQVSVPSPPLPRSWHSSCTIDGSQMVVFGGKGEAGNLLNDTCVLDLRDTAAPCWRKISMAWHPPGVLGHSLCTTTGSKIFMFGGLQSSGSVRLRTNDIFLLDLAAGAPCWQYVSGSTLPSGSALAGQAPTPRLEAVAGQLLGGRLIVFGGSTTHNDAACTDVYTVNLEAERPAWQKISVRGNAPERGWGFSACTIGGSKVVLPVADGVSGQLLLNEFSELSLVSLEEEASPQPRDRRKAPLPWGAKYPSMMSTTCAADMAAARQAAQLPELIGQHYLARAMAGALNPPGASSDRTTEIEDSAQPAGPHGSVQAMNHKHSGDNTTSGDDTVTSPLACGEGSNSAGEGNTMARAARPAHPAGSPSGTPDDNASTTTRKRQLAGGGASPPSLLGAPGAAARPPLSDEKAAGLGGSTEGSGQLSSSLDSTPSGGEDEKSTHDNEENQCDARQPPAPGGQRAVQLGQNGAVLGATPGLGERPQQCRSSQVGPSLDDS